MSQGEWGLFSDGQKMLEAAIELAVKSHKGQKDKAGKPYILHLMTVCLAQTDLKTMTVGILHDLLEDTPVTPAYLRCKGYPNDVVEAVMDLTKLEGETRMDAARRAGANALSLPVKIADVKHNLVRKRLSTFTEKDMEREAEYHAVLEYLYSVQT